MKTLLMMLATALFTLAADVVKDVLKDAVKDLLKDLSDKERPGSANIYSMACPGLLLA